MAVPLSPTPVQVVSEAKPEDMTIDQLLDGVDAIRAKKAELEKKEAAMLKAMVQKVEKQKARIDGLGVVVPENRSTIPPVGTPGPSIVR